MRHTAVKFYFGASECVVIRVSGTELVSAMYSALTALHELQRKGEGKAIVRIECEVVEE